MNDIEIFASRAIRKITTLYFFNEIMGLTDVIKWSQDLGFVDTGSPNYYFGLCEYKLTKTGSDLLKRLEEYDRKRKIESLRLELKRLEG